MRATLTAEICVSWDVLGSSGEMHKWSIFTQIWEKPEDMSCETASYPHLYSTFSLCKMAKTSSINRVPPNYKVSHSGNTRTSSSVALIEAEVTTESPPLGSLPLVVQPPSAQAEGASVVEAMGASSDPIAGLRVRVTPQK